MEKFTFVLALALLFTHELDAVDKREWRMIPFLNRAPDKTGAGIFVFAHVPIFAVCIWFLFGVSATSTGAFMIGFSFFCIAHAFAHLAYRNHPENGFKTVASQGLIWGSSAFGAAYLFLVT